MWSYLDRSCLMIDQFIILTIMYFKYVCYDECLWCCELRQIQFILGDIIQYIIDDY
jgi:hypothetical protein